MKNKLFMIGTILALVEISAPWGGSAAVTQAAGNPLAARIQNILEIKSHGTDMLTPLAGILKEFSADPDKASQDMDALVQALNDGAVPDALSSKVLASIHVDSPFVENKRWQYGQYPDIRNLGALLYRTAVKWKDRNPKKAAAYARASILLPAHYNYTGSINTIAGISNAKDFQTLADLTDEQLKSIKDMARSGTDEFQKWYMASFYKVAQAADVLIKEKEKLPQAELDRALAALSDARELAWRRPEYAQLFAHAAWQLRLIAEDRKDDAALQQINKHIIQWRSEAPQKQMKRWLTEAMQMKGRPPTSPYVSDAARHNPAHH